MRRKKRKRGREEERDREREKEEGVGKGREGKKRLCFRIYERKSMWVRKLSYIFK